MFSNKNKFTGISYLIERIDNNSISLQNAYFDELPLTTREMTQLSKALENNTNLKYLSLLGCRLTAVHIQILLKAIEKNSSLIGVGIETFENDDANLIMMIDKIKNHINQNKKESKNDLQKT